MGTQPNTTLMFHPVLAVILGTGVGMLLSVGGQKALNAHYIETCPAKPMHQLVMITSVIGDSYYCIHKKYL